MYKDGRKLTKQEKRKQEKEKKKQDKKKRFRDKLRKDKKKKNKKGRKPKGHNFNKGKGKGFDKGAGTNQEGQKNNLSNNDNVYKDFNSDEDQTPYHNINNEQESIPYPDIQNNNGMESEDKETFMDKMKERATQVKNGAKRAWKWFRRLRYTGYALSFLSAFAVPIMIGLFLFFFVVAPLMLIVLPSGAYVALGGDDENTEEVDDDKENKKDDDKDDDKQGEGKVDKQSKKEFVKGHKDPAPDAGFITSVFGHRESPGGVGTTDHGAWDLAPGGGGGTGDDINVFQSGDVVSTTEGCVEGDHNCGGGFGNHVIVEHSKNYRTIYAHLSKVKSKEKDSLSAGDKVGEMGSTGSSTAPHLHFEVRESDDGKDFEKVDPDDYFTDHDKEFL